MSKSWHESEIVKWSYWRAGSVYCETCCFNYVFFIRPRNVCFV